MNALTDSDIAAVVHRLRASDPEAAWTIEQLREVGDKAHAAHGAAFDQAMANGAKLAECRNSLAEETKRAERAEAIADDAAISAIECHGALCNGAYPGWMSIKGEPVDCDADYLVARGLLERDALLPYIVRLKGAK